MSLLTRLPIVALCFCSMMLLGCTSSAEHRNFQVARAPVIQEMKASTPDGEMITVSRSIIGWRDYANFESAAPQHQDLSKP